MSRGVENLNQFVSQYGTIVVFTQEAFRDYKSFPQRSRHIILEMVVKQAQKGAARAGCQENLATILAEDIGVGFYLFEQRKVVCFAVDYTINVYTIIVNFIDAHINCSKN